MPGSWIAKGFVALAVALGAGSGLAFADPPAGAATTATGTVLFSHTFAKKTLTNDGAGGTPTGNTAYGGVVMPAAPTGTNVACLTTTGVSATSPIPHCAGIHTATGKGALRLTPNSTTQEGGVFSAVSVPSSGGLDITYTSSLWGGTGADGTAFVLAAVTPTHPLSPASMGQPGGSLGYSAIHSTNKSGLDDGYLGVGFDTYGNFITATYQGTGCTDPSWEPTTTLNAQVTVRGPGNGTVGYCALNSTAAADTGTSVALQGQTRTASNIPVEVVVNTTTSTVTSKDGVVVPPDTYAVTFTAIGAAGPSTLTGPLPDATGTLPSAWLDATGVPKQMAFGWVASTSTKTDIHPIRNAEATSITPVPLLQISQQHYGATTAGSPITYTDQVKVGATGASESTPITVTDTLPTGVTPGSAGGTGWTCPLPTGQTFTCTHTQATTLAPGATVPTLYVSGTAKTGLTQTELSDDNVAVTSSADGDPAYSSTSATGTKTVTQPVVTTITPDVGPLNGAGTIAISGTNLATATAVEFGTATQIAAGTATSYAVCPSGTTTTGCFVAETSRTLTVYTIPAEPKGTVEVDVIAYGTSGYGTFTYTAPSFATGSTASMAGDVGTYFSHTPQETGGIGTVTFSFTSVPSWLGATATTGKVSGTAPSTGTGSFTISATDTDGQTATQTVDYTVNAGPTFTPSSVSVGWDTTTSGFSYSPSGDLVGGTAPYTWSLTGTLPMGTGFAAATGTITGTPSATGTVTVVLTATDASTATASQTVTITISAGPTLSPASATAHADEGQPFTYTPPAPTGGTAPFTWSLAPATPGSIPSGFGVTATTGVVSGTTTTATGTYAMVLTATDAAGEQTSQTLTVVLATAPTFTNGTAVSQTLTETQAYSDTPTVTGGSAPLSYTVAGLPAWAHWTAATHTVTGTVSSATGTSGSYMVTATDQAGVSVTQTVTYTIAAAPAFTPSSVTQTWDVTATGFTYRPATDLSAGTAPYTWTSAGTLPPGTLFTPEVDLITGRPTATGTFTSTITVTDANTVSATQTVTITINAAPTFATASVTRDADDGEPFTYTPPAPTGGTGPFTWTLTGAAATPANIPTGFSVTATTGVVSGTTTTATGTYPMVLTATDAAGEQTSQTLTVVLATAPTFTNGTSLSQALTATETYSDTPVVNGGSGTMQFSYQTLPGWAHWTAATHTVTGTVSTVTGTSGSYVLHATDQAGVSVSQTVSYTIAAAPALTPSSVTQTWDVTTAFTYQAATDLTGGLAPFSWKLATGSLPTGLSLTATTGTISGTPATTGMFTAKVQVTDANGVTATQTLHVSIEAIPLAGKNGSITADVSVPFTYTPVAPSGGTGPFTWSSGTSGFTVNPTTGVITGTFSRQTTFRGEEVATDAAGNSVFETVTVVVNAAPKVTATTTVTTDAGRHVTEQLAVTGGTRPFTWSVTAGQLPAGLTLDSSTGAVSGAIHEPGTDVVTLTATDAAGGTATAQITFVAKPSSQNSHAIASMPTGKGYWVATSTGTVDAYGHAVSYGDASGLSLAAPIIGIESTPDGQGYWLVASGGGVFSFGDAHFYGSVPGLVMHHRISGLAAPIVGMVPTPDGQGYWLVASGGGVFSFGDAHFYGSVPGLVMHHRISGLAAPIVGMVPTPDGQGYWLVGADGGVFSFGDAIYHGSVPALEASHTISGLAAPIVGIAATPDGQGYWLVGADGGVFSFGDATYHGSVPALEASHTISALAAPIVGVTPTPDAKGYWLVGAHGGVFSFGDAHFYGSTGDATPPPSVG